MHCDKRYFRDMNEVLRELKGSRPGVSRVDNSLVEEVTLGLGPQE